MTYDNHVIAYEVSQLSHELADFMDTYRATLVAEVRMAIPMLVQLAVQIEDATTMSELITLRAELSDFMKAIRYLTPKN